MMRLALQYILSILALLGLLSACTPGEALAPPTGLSSLRVTIENDTGSPESPLLVPDDGLELQLAVEAIDAEGNAITDYSGSIRISARNAFLGRNGWLNVDIANGDVVSAKLMRGFGSMRFLVEDTGTFVVGVSEPIYLPEPTIAMVQTPTGQIDGSPWSDHFVRVAKGTLVVTYVSLDGFYLTDVDSDAYNSMYVYTHGIPYTDAGDVLSYVSGTVSEFYGLTEMSFPDYDVRCNFHSPPTPVELTQQLLADDTVMERYEAGLVSLTNLKVYRVDDNDYLNYGQWVGRAANGAEVTMLTLDALPLFDPREGSNRTAVFEKVVGVLRQHWSAKPEWIVIPRTECDIWGVGERPAYCDEAQPATNCSNDNAN
jgi:hypothetical protein